MCNLSKLTIVIPSLNRQAYALRNMQYWSGREVVVHVIDGTVRPLSASALRALGGNVHYHHRPDSLPERLAFASKLIRTPYAALCADDEFFPPSGLDACISYLEGNPDYTACCGRSVGFVPKGNRLALMPVKTFHRDHTVDQPSIEKRIRYHIGNFMVTTIYGIHRADSFRHCLTFTAQESFSSPYVAETLFELVAAAQGKSRIIPNVSWLRSFENRPVQTRKYNRSRSLSEWYSDPAAGSEVDRFHQVIRSAIDEIARPDDREDAWRAAVEALQVRIETDRLAQSSRPRPGALRLVLRPLLGPARRALSGLLTPSKPEAATDFYTGPADYSYRRLKSSDGIIIDEAELGEIFQVILRFHSAVPPARVSQ